MRRRAATGTEKRGSKKGDVGSGERAQLRPRQGKKFLAAYKEAWETRNPELAANLFTRDAHYWENPFGKEIVGRDAICTYWKKATDPQEDIHFSVHNIFHTRYTLIAEWACTYTHHPSGERRELAGVLLADFYGGQVRNFREYWHRRVH